MIASTTARTASTSPTAAIAELVTATMDGEVVVREATRHVLDTVGCIIAGRDSNVALAAASLQPDAGCASVAYRLGVAAHSLEFDDGHLAGSVHPGVVVIPAALAVAGPSTGGRAFLDAVAAGYEAMIAIATAAHPAVRHAGYHPTGVVGVFGATIAAAHILRLSPAQAAQALGIAASGAAGLFAFTAGGADVKALHAGHAAREGVLSACFAAQGISGPPDILTAHDGFAQVFCRTDDFFPDASRSLRSIAGTYIKPYPCCRHLQPALGALLGILEDYGLRHEDIETVAIDTYSIAAAHAATGWQAANEAQLSFRYVLATALLRSRFTLDDVTPERLTDRRIVDLARRITIVASPDMDARYPAIRPARATVRTRHVTYTRTVEEAYGAATMPMSDADLEQKFTSLVARPLGDAGAGELARTVWSLGEASSIERLHRVVAGHG